MSQQRTSDQSSSSPFIFCKQCTKPLFPLSSVITEKANVWSDTVYTYELEDVLGETPCSVYSATTPGQQRFDVFRVRTQNQWAQPNITINFSAKKKAYSGDHSWFPPSRWNVLKCGNCSSHLGWGFHYFDEEKKKKLKEEREEKEEKSKKENEDAKSEDEKEQNEPQAENKEEVEQEEDTEEDEKQEEKHHEEDFFPEFLGIIFSRIFVKDLRATEWSDYLRQRSSITVNLRLHLLREAWPALHAEDRYCMLNLMKKTLEPYDRVAKIVLPDLSRSDDEANKADDDRQQQIIEMRMEKDNVASLLHRARGEVANTAVLGFELVVSGYDRIIHAATSFISRLRERRDENPEDPALRRPHRIPFLRPTIDLREYEVTPEEDEHVLFPQNIDEAQKDDEYATKQKAVQLIRAFYNRWHEQTEREYNRYKRDLEVGRLSTDLPAVRFGDDDDDDQDDERPGEDSEASTNAGAGEVNNEFRIIRDAMEASLMRFFGRGAAVRREREDHIEEDEEQEQEQDE